jgi:hypothetical protein
VRYVVWKKKYRLLVVGPFSGCFDNFENNQNDFETLTSNITQCLENFKKIKIHQKGHFCQTVTEHIFQAGEGHNYIKNGDIKHFC